ncbi:hypothetical protein ACFQ8O_03270 [Streptomyces coelicoflavus]|uniref:hypothetical protein n=1 Tax=Streptomyces coelicoflavus TaxID=285562 RepID=UPI00368644C2
MPRCSTNSSSEGAFIRKTDPALHDFLLEMLNGEYGIPCRLARALAGRDLAGSAVLALIDFALNPVVPGLHPDAPSVGWKELYPPYRCAAAAKAMTGWETDPEFQYPSHEATVHFQHMLAKRSGLRMGSVASRLSDLSTLRESARRQYAPSRQGRIPSPSFTTGELTWVA